MIQSDLPSYNIDSSTVYLIYNNEIIDKVTYSENWHFQLIDDRKGKSLERISVLASSSDSTNWHTAAEGIGFATPGEKNSQFQPNQGSGDFSFTSKVISPDNDGYEDVLQINYEMKEASMVGSLTIYDDHGIIIRKLAKNELLATKGQFIWDGISDDQSKANIGTYIAVFEVFNLNGSSVFVKKQAFVVAGKI
jgi:hypothetical protein